MASRLSVYLKYYRKIVVYTFAENGIRELAARKKKKCSRMQRLSLCERIVSNR